MSGRGPGTNEQILFAMPRTRFKAWESGVKYFFPNTPCVRGHVTYRYTNSNQCAGCVAEMNRRTLKTHPLTAFRNGRRIDGTTFGPSERRGTFSYDEFVRRKRTRYATDPEYRKRYRETEKLRQRERRARLKDAMPPPDVLAAAEKRAQVERVNHLPEPTRQPSKPMQ